MEGSKTEQRKDVLECREDSELIGLLLQCRDYQSFRATIKMRYFSIEFSPKSVQFWVEILTEGIKLVVTDKHDFKCRKTSKLGANFASFGKFRF